MSTKVERIKRKAASIKSSLSKYGVTGITTKELTKMLTEGVTCPYCGEHVPNKQVSVDHIQPRSKGGADAKENIHFTCLSCNLMKGDLLDEEFKLLLDWLADKPEIYKNLRRRLKSSGWGQGWRR